MKAKLFLLAAVLTMGTANLSAMDWEKQDNEEFIRIDQNVQPQKKKYNFKELAVSAKNGFNLLKNNHSDIKLQNNIIAKQKDRVENNLQLMSAFMEDAVELMQKTINDQNNVLDLQDSLINNQDKTDILMEEIAEINKKKFLTEMNTVYMEKLDQEQHNLAGDLNELYEATTGVTQFINLLNGQNDDSEEEVVIEGDDSRKQEVIESEEYFEGEENVENEVQEITFEEALQILNAKNLLNNYLSQEEIQEIDPKLESFFSTVVKIMKRYTSDDINDVNNIEGSIFILVKEVIDFAQKNAKIDFSEGEEQKIYDVIMSHFFG